MTTKKKTKNAVKQSKTKQNNKSAFTGTMATDGVSVGAVIDEI